MTPLENATKTAEGVVVNGFVLSPVVEQCNGCERMREFDGEQFCSSYPAPARKGCRPLQLCHARQGARLTPPPK